MEILKRGKVEGEKSAEFTCNKCISRLRATLSEAKKTDSDRDGIFATFECPVCSKDIYIATEIFSQENDMKEDMTLLNFLGYCLMTLLVIVPFVLGIYLLGWKLALACTVLSATLGFLLNLAYTLIKAE